MDLEIQSQLRSLGLHRTEVKIFLFLLRNGRSTIKNVSRGTSIAKSNCYYVVRQLLTKKLIAKSQVNNEVAFEATDPEMILDYAKNVQDLAKSVLPELKSAFYSGSGKIQSMYYDSEFEIASIFAEAKTHADLVYFGPQPVDPPFLKYFLKDISGLVPKKQIILTNKLNTFFILFGDKVALLPISSKPSLTLLQNREVRQSILQMIKCFT